MGGTPSKWPKWPKWPINGSYILPKWDDPPSRLVQIDPGGGEISLGFFFEKKTPYFGGVYQPMPEFFKENIPEVPQTS